MSDNALQAIVFDMDGVLVDSTQAHFEAYRRVFAARGKGFELADYREKALGKSRATVIREQLQPETADDFDRAMQAKSAFVHEYLEQIGLSPIDGVVEFVGRLGASDLDIAVATSSRMPRAFLDAADLTRHFEVIVDSTMVERDKPAPDIYLEAARRLGVGPERCATIEDSAVGALAGRRAGTFVVGLTTTEPRSSLGAADVVCASVDAICNLFVRRGWIGQ